MVKSKIHFTVLFFCFAYFLYSIIISFYDFSNLKYLQWTNAENESSVYSSRRSTTVTYNFIKDDVRVSRKYPGIFEGINTWLWKINKEESKQNISFFIFQRDFEKIKNNQIVNRKDIFGNKLNEIQSIPFFGMRKIGEKAGNASLFLDLWKYNYSIFFAFVLFILPYTIFFVIENFFKLSLKEEPNTDVKSKIGAGMILCFGLLIINLIV